MYTNFIKAIQEDNILPIEVTDIRESLNMVDLDIPTTDAQVVAQVVNMISKWIGDKNQDIYVERFIGCDTTTIAIENPVLKWDRDNDTTTDMQGRDRSDYANIIEEINTHELGDEKPIELVS